MEKFIQIIHKEEEESSSEQQQLPANKTNGFSKQPITKKGNFKYGDKIEKIVYASPILVKTIEDKFILVVKWKPRSNGEIPKKSLLTNREVQASDPLILSQFYEKILLRINSKRISKKGKCTLMFNEN